eukprot:TRINITY_DN11290_c0_g1_i1.p1 TRINITY_DN11290_c0_g1~~TRINITY_DN11290_c0_g1_i1.p1  ORF type:complete len:1905 (-),score=358.25 TRINITY_DN11290_c0_g1_i1:75-5789(-)
MPVTYRRHESNELLQRSDLRSSRFQQAQKALIIQKLHESRRSFGSHLQHTSRTRRVASPYKETYSNESSFANERWVIARRYRDEFFLASNERCTKLCMTCAQGVVHTLWQGEEGLPREIGQYLYQREHELGQWETELRTREELVQQQEVDVDRHQILRATRDKEKLLKAEAELFQLREALRHQNDTLPDSEPENPQIRISNELPQEADLNETPPTKQTEFMQCVKCNLQLDLQTSLLAQDKRIEFEQRALSMRMEDIQLREAALENLQKDLQGLEAILLNERQSLQVEERHSQRCDELEEENCKLKHDLVRFIATHNRAEEALKMQASDLQLLEQSLKAREMSLTQNEAELAEKLGHLEKGMRCLDEREQEVIATKLEMRASLLQNLQSTADESREMDQRLDERLNNIIQRENRMAVLEDEFIKARSDFELKTAELRANEEECRLAIDAEHDQLRNRTQAITVQESELHQYEARLKAWEQRLLEEENLMHQKLAKAEGEIDLQADLQRKKFAVVEQNLFLQEQEVEQWRRRLGAVELGLTEREQRADKVAKEASEFERRTREMHARAEEGLSVAEHRLADIRQDLEVKRGSLEARELELLQKTHTLTTFEHQIEMRRLELEQELLAMERTASRLAEQDQQIRVRQEELLSLEAACMVAECHIKEKERSIVQNFTEIEDARAELKLRKLELDQWEMQARLDIESRVSTVTQQEAELLDMQAKLTTKESYLVARLEQAQILEQHVAEGLRALQEREAIVCFESDCHQRFQELTVAEADERTELLRDKIHLEEQTFRKEAELCNQQLDKQAAALTARSEGLHAEVNDKMNLLALSQSELHATTKLIQQREMDLASREQHCTNILRLEEVQVESRLAEVDVLLAHVMQREAALEQSRIALQERIVELHQRDSVLSQKEVEFANKENYLQRLEESVRKQSAAREAALNELAEELERQGQELCNHGQIAERLKEAEETLKNSSELLAQQQSAMETYRLHSQNIDDVAKLCTCGVWERSLLAPQQELTSDQNFLLLDNYPVPEPLGESHDLEPVCALPPGGLSPLASSFRTRRNSGESRAEFDTVLQRRQRMFDERSAMLDAKEAELMDWESQLQNFADAIVRGSLQNQLLSHLIEHENALRGNINIGCELEYKALLVALDQVIHKAAMVRQENQLALASTKLLEEQLKVELMLQETVRRGQILQELERSLCVEQSRRAAEGHRSLENLQAWQKRLLEMEKRLTEQEYFFALRLEEAELPSGAIAGPISSQPQNCILESEPGVPCDPQTRCPEMNTVEIFEPSFESPPTECNENNNFEQSYNRDWEDKLKGFTREKESMKTYTTFLGDWERRLHEWESELMKKASTESVPCDLDRREGELLELERQWHIRYTELRRKEMALEKKKQELSRVENTMSEELEKERHHLQEQKQHEKKERRRLLGDLDRQRKRLDLREQEMQSREQFLAEIETQLKQKEADLKHREAEGQEFAAIDLQLQIVHSKEKQLLEVERNLQWRENELNQKLQSFADPSREQEPGVHENIAAQEKVEQQREQDLALREYYITARESEVIALEQRLARKEVDLESWDRHLRSFSKKRTEIDTDTTCDSPSGFLQREAELTQREAIVEAREATAAAQIAELQMQIEELQQRLRSAEVRSTSGILCDDLNQWEDAINTNWESLLREQRSLQLLEKEVKERERQLDARLDSFSRERAAHFMAVEVFEQRRIELEARERLLVYGTLQPEERSEWESQRLEAVQQRLENEDARTTELGEGIDDQRSEESNPVLNRTPANQKSSTHSRTTDANTAKQASIYVCKAYETICDNVHSIAISPTRAITDLHATSIRKAVDELVHWVSKYNPAAAAAAQTQSYLLLRPLSELSTKSGLGEEAEEMILRVAHNLFRMFNIC